MSKNLSFTQELRELGLIAKPDTNDSVNTGSVEKRERNTNKTKVKKSNSDNSFMIIGRRHTMNYVLTINNRMLDGLDKITIKSRGKNISKAVDVAEIVTNRFITDANDDEVRLATEEIFHEDGTSTNISTIEIDIQRQL